MYKMCTVTRPNLLADCQLSVVRPRKIGTNHPLQWVVVDYEKGFVHMDMEGVKVKKLWKNSKGISCLGDFFVILNVSLRSN